ncbi:hypothetical protein [Metamycoplasma equirhinis]|uniref:hypothetical protein n=1 Tax=Metamycoplasma equirhinis TaxID=92402 RepID=UPI00359451AD
MAKWFYRLRGSNTTGKNAKSFPCGSAYQYDKAMEIAKEVIDKKQYKEVQIERIQIIKIVRNEGDKGSDKNY